MSWQKAAKMPIEALPRCRRKKAQLSLEALLAMAALLSALAMFIFSAEKIGGWLYRSAQESSERCSLSSSALFVDTAAGSLSSFRISHALRGIPSQDGWWLMSESAPAVREPVFHAVSADQSGGIYVQQNPGEPI